MPAPQANVVTVSTDGGVITAKIAVRSVDERPATAILTQTMLAMGQVGQGLTTVVLDFGDVDFINSSGLAACIELRNNAGELGAKTIIYRPKDAVTEVFKMVRVDRLYAFAHTADELESLVS
jgi:anti-anti-sigma factor